MDLVGSFLHQCNMPCISLFSLAISHLEHHFFLLVLYFYIHTSHLCTLLVQYKCNSANPKDAKITPFKMQVLLFIYAFLNTVQVKHTLSLNTNINEVKRKS